MLQQRRIKIVVDPKGNYTMEAMDGFIGNQCSEKLHELELVLGGTIAGGEKKPEYYGSDPFDPLTLKL